MSSRLSISVEGIELRGRCGVTAEERAVGQTLIVDVHLEPVACPGAQSDDLAGTVDYGWVVDVVRGIVRGRRVQAARAPRRRSSPTPSGTALDLRLPRGRRHQARAAGRHPDRGRARGGRAHRVSEPPRSRVFVSLGSNLGDRLRSLAAAREALAALAGHRGRRGLADLRDGAHRTTQSSRSSSTRSCVSRPACSRTIFCAECQRIENEHGRVRGLRFGPRTLDVDILLFQDVESEEPELMLPHPRMLRRAFVLVPLAEIWGWARGMPDLDVAALAQAAAREQAVRPYDVPEA